MAVIWMGKKRSFRADGESRIRQELPRTDDGFYVVGRFRPGKKGDSMAKQLVKDHKEYRRRLGFVEGTRVRLAWGWWFVESKLLEPPYGATWSIAEKKWI